MKTKRQNLICELISRYEIETQDELVNKLKENGMNVTQATVSRDIRELKLNKGMDKNGKNRYILPGEESGDQTPLAARRFSRVLQEGFVSCEAAGNLVVVRTMTGMANAVAAALDNIKLSEVVGSLAGDDTIFLAVKTAEDGEALKSKIRSMAE